MPKVIGDPGSGKRLFKVTLDGVKGYAHAVDETDAIKAVRDVGGISYCVHQAAVAVDGIDPEDAVEADVVAVNDELTSKKLDGDTTDEKLQDELEKDKGNGNVDIDAEKEAAKAAAEKLDADANAKLKAEESEANAIRKELKAHPKITNAEVVQNLKAKDIKVTSAQVTKVRNAESV